MLELEELNAYSFLGSNRLHQEFVAKEGEIVGQSFEFI